MDKVYVSWLGIKQRCYNPNNKDYRHYGGRGISVCDEWRQSFSAYKNYMGKPPTPKHSIDRIDNDGDYKPGNVRWATQQEQLSNRRPGKLWSTAKLYTSNKSGYRGVGFHKAKGKWQARASINGIERHLGYFDSPELAYGARQAAISK